jgi:3-methyladenine DNA glycosylase AlkC
MSKNKPTNIPLKDYYTKEYISLLINNLLKYYPSFKEQSFINTIFDSSWEEKELKERLRHITITLHSYLPKDYKEAIKILVKTCADCKYYDMHSMFFPDYVELYGLDDWGTSFYALEEFTKYGSSEFAIRQFILQDEDKAMRFLKRCAKSENFHVRRFASEGCRPRLPWSIALSSFKKDPTKVLEILEILQDDKENYVKKSVANNLNDIAKDNPRIVIDTAKKWYGEHKDKNWIVKHACRTLLKNGNEEVLKLFDFVKRDDVKLTNINLKDKVNIGKELDFYFTLNSKQKLGNLRIEYIVEFVRQNNKTSKKVFFIASKEYRSNSVTIKKKHSFKPITIRKYYEGVHKLSIVVNGAILDTKTFYLES